MGNRDTWRRTSPVGSFRANGIGVYDMAGNVLEMCLDWYDDRYYEHSPVVNPRGQSSGTHHVMRGGSWDDPRMHCRTTIRRTILPDEATKDVGFRIVKEVE